MSILARTLLASSLLMLTTTVFAHDSWIQRGGHRNGAGEWCCGEGDCFVVPRDNISVTSQGYRLKGTDTETVPYSEAQPSPDGAYWRCKRPDGSRRCFFAPPQTY